MSDLRPLYAGALGALAAAAFAPKLSQYVPKVPSDSFETTPIGMYGSGLLDGGVILGSVLLFSKNEPHLAGALIGAVSVRKLWAIRQNPLGNPMGMAYAAAAGVVGGSLLFGGESETAAIVATGLGAMAVAGSAIMVLSQNKVNEEALPT